MDLSFIKDWSPQSVKLVVVENGATNIEHQENYYGNAQGENGGAKTEKPLTDEELKERIERARRHITTKRHWFSVCKYLMWHRVVADGDFAAAVVKIDSLCPGLELDAKDLSRMNVQSFRKTLDKWDENDAPVKNTFFTKYVIIAELMEA